MEAQHELLTGAPGRLARTAALYRQAAEHGDPLAAYDLGYCYETGLGVPANAKEASFWYRLAAVNGGNPAVQRIAAARLATLTQTASADPPQSP